MTVAAGVGEAARGEPRALAEQAAADVVVVTGGASGIGRATCLRLGADGFRVAVWDLDAARAQAVAGEIAAAGGSSVGIACDVARRDQVDAAAAQTLEQFGGVYGVVNNAGIDRLSVFVDSNPDDWRAIIDVNLIGTLNVSQSLLPRLIEAGRGRIVCISSDAARVGSTGEAVYAATKAGVLGFVKTLAREVARNGICVNAVCPGPTDTALLESVRQGPKGDKIIAAMTRAVPLGRVAAPVDIAAAIAFFLGPDAGYITGQTLSVSGGLTMA